MSPLFDSLVLLDDKEPRRAALNMALDEVLLRRLGTPVLRVYRWISPAVSFGYFEPFAPVRNLYPALDLVRRWTGGGIVLHGRDFTYSLLVGNDHWMFHAGPEESYRGVHEAVAAALNSAGVPVTPVCLGREKVSQSCFENPVPHDLLLGDRKIAGAAQRRTKHGLLHQGSIQNIEHPEDLAERLAKALCMHCIDAGISAVDLGEAEKLEAEKYATDAWTRRL